MIFIFENIFWKNRKSENFRKSWKFRNFEKIWFPLKSYWKLKKWKIMIFDFQYDFQWKFQNFQNSIFSRFSKIFRFSKISKYFSKIKNQPFWIIIFLKCFRIFQRIRISSQKNDKSNPRGFLFRMKKMYKNVQKRLTYWWNESFHRLYGLK